MMDRTAVLFALWAAVAAANSNFRAPLAGLARDSQQDLRLMYGGAGNFIVKDRVARGVEDVAFSASGGLARTSTELLLLDAAGTVTRTVPVSHGAMILTAGSTRSAPLYFDRETGQLWEMLPRAGRRVPIRSEMIAGHVRAIESQDAQHALMAVCRDARLWLLTIHLSSGRVLRQRLTEGAIEEVACRSGAVLLFDGAVLLATSTELVVESPAGDEYRIPLVRRGTGDVVMRRVGASWVEIESPGEAPLLVRPLREGERVYRMPAAEAAR